MKIDACSAGCRAGARRRAASQRRAGPAAPEAAAVGLRRHRASPTCWKRSATSTRRRAIPRRASASPAASELARQIEQGAEADMFISADEAWMDYAGRQGADRSGHARRRCSPTSSCWSPRPTRRSALEIAAGMDLAGALKGGKLALANPDSVPAGKYARRRSTHFGAWEAVEAQCRARRECARGPAVR